MLIGQFTSKLTDKGRISVPKKLRGELGEEIIISRWYEKCLVVVGKEGWKELMSRIIGKNDIITSPVRDIDRFVLGSAFEIGLDSQGRFVLPDLLTAHSGITTEAVFVGLGDRVEIWSKENWDEIEATAEQKANEAIEKIAKENK